MKIIDEIEYLNELSAKEERDILDLMREFAVRATDFLGIERINIWLFNNKRDAIFSIAEYDKRYNEFNRNTWVYVKEAPKYFEYLSKEKIILAPNVHTHPATCEFNNTYNKQYNIISLMDIPLRLQNKLVGVMCFEKTGNTPKVFSESEQTFALVLSQLVLANIENYKRQVIQEKLEEALKSKELLIKELHHRVKNNFSVLVSLLRLSKSKLNETKEDVFEAFEHQVFSMLKVHELLTEEGQYKYIDVTKYLKKLSQEFLFSYDDLKNQFIFNIPDRAFEISAKDAINLGLIITEIFLNSLKYSLLSGNTTFEISVKFLSDKELEIIIGDDGKGFDFEKMFQTKQSLGLEIIKGLSESSNFEIQFPTLRNPKYKITIYST